MRWPWQRRQPTLYVIETPYAQMFNLSWDEAKAYVGVRGLGYEIGVREMTPAEIKEHAN